VIKAEDGSRFVNHVDGLDGMDGFGGGLRFGAVGDRYAKAVVVPRLVLTQFNQRRDLWIPASNTTRA